MAGISDSQIKGIIALGLMMAVIPFFHFFYLLYSSHKPPAFTEQFLDSLAVEIVEKDRMDGIYFLEPGTSAKQLFQAGGFGEFPAEDLVLRSGMKIIIDKQAQKGKVSVSGMDAAQRLVLGMPLDINKAGKDDLIMIKGIGEATAKKIIELREKSGRFTNIEQLTRIKGIKENKLAQFRKYLFVEKQKR